MNFFCFRYPYLSRRKRDPNFSNEGEVCRTSFTTSSQFQACHARSNRMVSLYLYRGANQTERELFLQMFVIGDCASSTPVSIPTSPSSASVTYTCREAMTSVLAYFIATPEEAAAHRYKGCVNTPIAPTRYLLCRDFILVQTLCKLYHS